MQITLIELSFYPEMKLNISTFAIIKVFPNRLSLQTT